MAKMNLYVKGFHYTTVEEELRDYFKQFGEINSMKLVQTESELHEPSGFAYVSFKTADQALKAKIESQKILFKESIKLTVCYHECKEQRKAHNEEKYDKMSYERYKK